MNNKSLKNFIREMIYDYVCCFPIAVLVALGLFIGRLALRGSLFALVDFRILILYLAIHAAVVIAFLVWGNKPDVRRFIARFDLRNRMRNGRASDTIVPRPSGQDLLFWVAGVALLIITLCFSAWSSAGVLCVFLVASLFKNVEYVVLIAIVLLAVVAIFSLVFRQGFESECLMFIVIPLMMASAVRVMRQP